MKPPEPRGPVSAAVRAGLTSAAGDEFLSVELPGDLDHILRDADLQLALWMLYEQSYRSFEGAHDHEWNPSAVALRRRLEQPFEEQLRAATAAVVDDALAIAGDVVPQIEHALAHAPGPDLARFLHREASREQVLDFLAQRSVYHRLRGAALGHLCAFESTSSVPCRRIAAGIERVGLPEATAAYFHEHVEADAAHEHIVLRDICGNFVESEPAQRAEVLFGVAACLYLDGLAAQDLLASWAGTLGGELAS